MEEEGRLQRELNNDRGSAAGAACEVFVVEDDAACAGESVDADVVEGRLLGWRTIEDGSVGLGVEEDEVRDEIAGVSGAVVENGQSAVDGGREDDGGDGSDEGDGAGGVVVEPEDGVVGVVGVQEQGWRGKASGCGGEGGSAGECVVVVAPNGKVVKKREGWGDRNGVATRKWLMLQSINDSIKNAKVSSDGLVGVGTKKDR